MQKLIIETFDFLDMYGRVDELFTFYPHGVRGLFIDYLKHYLTGPPILQDASERDDFFVHQFMDLYKASVEGPLFTSFTKTYMLYSVCVGVGTLARHVVEQNETELRHSVLDARYAEWGPNHVMFADIAYKDSCEDYYTLVVRHQ